MKTTGEPRSKEGGFSLIELLVGTLAAVVALGAIISVCIQVSKVRKTDEELNLAFIACMGSLESLRAIPHSNLPTMDGIGFDVPAQNGTPGGLTPQPGDADGLPGEFRITAVKTGAGKTLYRATATVKWSGSRGRQEFKLDTLMGNRRLE